MSYAASRIPSKRSLEITEIADRVMKSAGPALLFENVAGKSMPVLINAFGSMKRMALALGVNDVEEIAADIAKLIQTKPPKSFKDKFHLLGELVKLAGIPPKIVKEGAVPGSDRARARLESPAGAHLLARRRRTVHHFADGLFQGSR